MKVVVGWDVDDVIYPWYALAHQACMDFDVIKVGTPLPSSWAPYEEYGITDQAWFDALAEATLSGALYGGDPDFEAIRIMHDLHDLGVEQHIITARGFFQHGSQIKAQTKAMIEKYAIPHASLSFTKDKGLVARALGLTHAIDDNAKNFDDFQEAGAETYLVDRPWNRHHDVPPGRRITDLEQFARAVKRST